MRERGASARGSAWVVVLLLTAILVVSGGGGFVYGRGQLDAPSATHGPPVAIDVVPGESLGALAADLGAHGLIRSRSWFEQYARYRGLGDRLRSGRYMLDDGMGATAIIDRLGGRPDVATTRLVFSEGMTAVQMAGIVGTSGLGISAAQYLAETRSGMFDAPFLEGRPAGAPLEGFLFPDTYSVPAGAAAHDLVQLQLTTFGLKGQPALMKSREHLSTYQLVTLASVVEREAADAADRPLVAGVIHNRLAAGMLLQVDASVLYGLGIIGRNPTDVELAQDTPYNTYLHPGLPPTPIANPGAASLAAAAVPAQTPYVFYVADACGHNHYSTTLAGQQQAIAQYPAGPCR